MKLLIVDDQTSVVNGLMKGIEWEKMGFEEVYNAYNSYEARNILSAGNIDIMICDIEMPRENGLALLKWARDENLDIECIFLTAHAQFEYAKEAIKMGSFDYILQPAPYDEIKNVVYKAIKKVIDKQGQKKKSLYGELLVEQKGFIREKIIADTIEGMLPKDKYDSLCQDNKMPHWDQKCYQVIMQIFHMEVDINYFGSELLYFVLHNVANELFFPYEQDIIIVEQKKLNYSLVIYGANGYFMDYLGVLRQIILLKAVLEEYLKGQIAFYMGEAVTPAGMKEQYEQLNAMMKENVVPDNRIFQLKEDGISKMELHSTYCLPQLERWIKYLQQNLCNTVRTEIGEYLDHLAEQKEITQETLMLFHMDMIHMMFSIIKDKQIDTQMIFSKFQSKEVYTKATQSLDTMKAFVDTIIKIAEDSQKETIDSQDKVDIIKRYINENVEKDIKRTDIAECLHLNIDYLNRIFKKETGMALSEYIIQEKMNVARQLIKTTMLPISFIAARVGFSNFSHFSKSYKKAFNTSPSEERRVKDADN